MLAKGTNPDELDMLNAAVENLRTLANYFKARSRNLDAIVDLNDAIILHRYVRESCPTGHPRRASFLHDLALCLADRFRQQSTETDLDEAIALEREALRLHVPGSGGYDASRCAL
ncbi:hypothetical protein EDC04DRAFT_2650890, partial [Pisolithus marmoratus]